MELPHHFFRKPTPGGRELPPGPRNELLICDDAAFDSWLQAKSCSSRALVLHDPWKPKVEPGAKVLVTRQSGALFETRLHEPTADLEAFLGNTHFGVVGEDGDCVTRVDSRPLGDVLFAEFQKGRRGRKLRQLSHQLGDEWEHEDRLELAIIPDVEERLRAGHSLQGPIAICGCDLADCGSEYAWIERGVCLLLARLSAGGLKVISLFPFDVLSSWLDPRWLHAHEHEIRVPRMVADFDERLIIWVGAEVIDELICEGTATLNRSVGQPDHTETSLVADERLREASPQDLLQRAFTCVIWEDNDDPHAIRTSLRMESPLPVARLLQLAVARDDRRKLLRMHYAPQLKTDELPPPEVWQDGGMTLCEIYRNSGQIQGIILLPAPYDGGARGSWHRWWLERIASERKPDVTVDK